MSLPPLFPELEAPGDLESSSVLPSEELERDSDPVDALSRLLDLSKPFDEHDSPADPETGGEPPPFFEDPEKELEEYVSQYGEKEVGKIGVPLDTRTLLERLLTLAPPWSCTDENRTACCLAMLSAGEAEIAGDPAPDLVRQYVVGIDVDDSKDFLGLALVAAEGAAGDAEKAKRKLFGSEKTAEMLHALLVLHWLSPDEKTSSVLKDTFEELSKDVSGATDEFLISMLLASPVQKQPELITELDKRTLGQTDLIALTGQDLISRLQPDRTFLSDKDAEIPESHANELPLWHPTSSPDPAIGFKFLLARQTGKARRWYLSNLPKAKKSTDPQTLSGWVQLSLAVDSVSIEDASTSDVGEREEPRWNNGLPFVTEREMLVHKKKAEHQDV